MSRIGIILATTIALWSGSAAAGDKTSPFDRVPAVNGLTVTPTNRAATVHRFGSGVVVERPGHASQTVSPFGSGVIISEPGKPSVVCSRFGNGTSCR
jgi:hypothetical protein